MRNKSEIIQFNSYFCLWCGKFKYVYAEIRLESFGGKEALNFHQSLNGFEAMECSMWIIYYFMCIYNLTSLV